MVNRLARLTVLTSVVHMTGHDVCVAQELDNREIGSGYAHLVSFEAEPQIAGASFSVDSTSANESDTDISAIKLPLYREFESPNQPWDWYLQGAVSYLEMKSSVNLELTDDISSGIDQEWKAYGGLLEAGLVWPLGRGFSVASGLGLGISRLENTTSFDSALIEDLFAPSFEGVLYNWDTNASVARGSLDLRYDESFGAYRIKASTHLSYSYVDSFGESRSFAGFSDHSGMLTLKLDIRHPLNIELAEHPLYILGHIGNTTFVGSNREQLGFNYYNELGASLGVEKLSLGFLAFFGDNVEGYSLVFNYDY